MKKIKSVLKNKTLLPIYIVVGILVLVSISAVLIGRYQERHGQDLDKILTTAASDIDSKGYQKAIDALENKSGWSKEQAITADLALGQAYYGLKNVNKARSYYEEALQADVSNSSKSSYENLIANTYRDEANLDKAIEFYNLSVKDDFRNIQAWANLTYLYISKGDYDSAKSTIAAAKDKNPTSTEIASISKLLASK